jgi:hypothetical protein
LNEPATLFGHCRKATGASWSLISAVVGFLFILNMIYLLNV